MSFYDDAITAIETRFNAQWDATNDGSIHWPNVRFTAPDESDTPNTWVRIEVVPSDAPTASLGPAPLYRHWGIIAVSIFVPEGGGAGSANALAKKVQIIFRGQSFSGVVCRGTNAVHVGLTDDGWYQVNVDTIFYYDGTN